DGSRRSAAAALNPGKPRSVRRPDRLRQRCGFWQPIYEMRSLAIRADGPHLIAIDALVCDPGSVRRYSGKAATLVGQPAGFAPQYRYGVDTISDGRHGGQVRPVRKPGG